MVLVIYLYTLEIVTIELCFHFMQIISVKNSQRESCELDQELPVIILITPFFTFTGTWCNVIINRAQAYTHIQYTVMTLLMSTHALGWPQNGKILNSDLDSEDINRMQP